MKTTGINIKKLFYLLTATVLIFLAVAAPSYGGGKTLGDAGRTGYDEVRYRGDNYLTTDYGKFIVSEDAEIYNQDAEKIKFTDIKKSFMADIQYVRTKGQLMALEIIVKIKKEEELPE
ncbi:MAG: hypothetical protein JW944_06115 [Deltaproteobacteria bacterium]|nr:hypothetical protein [Deltaproteobacteria bacterium]